MHFMETLKTIIEFYTAKLKTVKNDTVNYIKYICALKCTILTFIFQRTTYLYHFVHNEPKTSIWKINFLILLHHTLKNLTCNLYHLYPLYRKYYSENLLK